MTMYIVQCFSEDTVILLFSRDREKIVSVTQKKKKIKSMIHSAANGRKSSEHQAVFHWNAM